MSQESHRNGPLHEGFQRKLEFCFLFQAACPHPMTLGRGLGQHQRLEAPTLPSTAAPPTLQSPGLWWGAAWGEDFPVYFVLYRVPFCLFNAMGWGAVRGVGSDPVAPPLPLPPTVSPKPAQPARGARSSAPPGAPLLPQARAHSVE